MSTTYSVSMLSSGALSVIMKGGQVDDPIVQVLGSKRIASGSVEKERYRILLSDGKHLISFAMMTTQITDQIVSGEIPTFSIIKIKRYITSIISNTGKSGDKRILVILDMELVAGGEMVGEKLGDPTQLPDDGNDVNGSSAPKRPAPKEEIESPAAPKRPVLSNNSSTSNNSMNVSLQEHYTQPISSLSPYQNKWVIKVRVMNKSAVRTWSNSKGEGKLFNVDLIDESGEIRCTGFRDAVDKFYDFIQVDKVYYISKCTLKMANKQFNNMKNDYEMTFTNESVIQEAEDDTSSVPTVQFDFKSIDTFANMNVGDLVDVIGICKQHSDVQQFTSKMGKELKKRELVLVDMSKTSVTLTLWGTDAENYDQTTPVVAIKGARIGEFGGGKNITLPGSGIIKYNPDIKETYMIRGWYDNGGDKEEASNISARSGGGSFQSNWLGFKEVKELGLGASEKGDYFQTKGTILLMRSENCFYMACPTENCNKKVVDMNNGQYKCEKCNAEYPNFKYRLIAQMNVGDWSGSQWLSMFSAEAETVLGKTAQEVGEASEAGQEELMEIINEINFKQFIFRCRAKFETYNDEARLKTVAVRVEPINYKEFNSYLISQVQQMMS